MEDCRVDEELSEQETLLRAAVRQLAEGAFCRALKSCERGVKLYFEDERFLLVKATALKELGRVRETKDVFEELVRREERPEFLVELGACCFVLRDTRRTIELCERALHLDPTFKLAGILLADVHRVLEDLSTGEQLLERFKPTKTDPIQIQSQFLAVKALIMGARGSERAGRECAVKASRIDPNNIGVLQVLRQFNPPVSSKSKVMTLQVDCATGTGFAGLYSSFHGWFEVIAESDSEALLYMCETKPMIGGDAKVTRLRVRSAPRSERKGVVVCYPSLSWGLKGPQTVQ